MSQDIEWPESDFVHSNKQPELPGLGPDPAKKVTYDPIEDEKKEFTLQEFSQILQDAAKDYEEVFDGANDFTKGKHTYNAWMAAFRGYMSW
jgi:hypothetical protein